MSAQSPPPAGASTSITILRELWRRKLLVALAVLASAAVSVLFIRSQHPQVEAEGSIQVLVDSAKSPIADANRDLGGLTARAGVFARLMTGGRVINRVADETGIPARRIDVAGPSPLPGEAPGITEAPAYVNPYRIEISQQPELPILTVITHAPTAAEARALAAAAPKAMSREVATLQTRQETKPSKRVEFRTLGPAQAALVDDSLGKKVAAGIFVVLTGLFLTLIVGLPRFRAAWRRAGAEAAGATAGEEPEPKSDAGVEKQEAVAKKSARKRRAAKKAARLEAAELAEEAARKPAAAAEPAAGGEPGSAKKPAGRPPLSVVGAAAEDDDGEARRESGEAGGGE